MKYPLSEREQALIEEYTMEAYPLNTFLRADSILTKKNFTEVLNKFPNFISKEPLYSKTRILTEDWRNMIKNKIYTDKAFLSTSMNKDGTRWPLKTDNDLEEYTAIKLTIIKHQSGKDVSMYSKVGNTDGKEVIFMPNTKFEIMKYHVIKDKDKGKRVRYIYIVDLIESDIQISEKEQALIEEYTGTKACQFNTFLRADSILTKTNFTEVLNKFPNFISKEPLYRGTRIPIEDWENMIKNEIYTDKAFLSTSMNKDAVEWHLRADIQGNGPEKYAAIKLTIIKHQSGKDVSMHSKARSTDGKEVIFMPNTKFKIMKHHTIKENIKGKGVRDIYIVDLVEIIPPEL